MKQEDPILKVLDKLDDLTTEVKALRSDVGTIKSDVIMQGFQLKTAETRVKAIQTDLSDIKKDVSSLKTDVRRLEVLHEETDGKIDSILEVVIPSSKQITKITEHDTEQDEKISFHERRIGFLENKVA